LSVAHGHAYVNGMKRRASFPIRTVGIGTAFEKPLRSFDWCGFDGFDQGRLAKAIATLDRQPKAEEHFHRFHVPGPCGSVDCRRAKLRFDVDTSAGLKKMTPDISVPFGEGEQQRSVSVSA